MYVRIDSPRRRMPRSRHQRLELPLTDTRRQRSDFRFQIGSVETFERKLDERQRELGIKTGDFIPVQYHDETSALQLFAR